MSSTLKNRPPVSRLAKWRNAGFSIVELMVGIVIGLFIVGGGLMFFTNLDESRRLLLEARLHQDLRDSANLITRDIRRAGHWSAAVQQISVTGAVNPNREIVVASTCAASPDNSTISYSFSRPNVATAEQVAFSRNGSTIQMQVGGQAAENLMDPAVTTITAFSICPILPTSSVALGGLCAPSCTGASCPQINVRGYNIVIEGHATADPSVKRRLTTSVRVRNDLLSGSCS